MSLNIPDRGSSSTCYTITGRQPKRQKHRHDKVTSSTPVPFEPLFQGMEPSDMTAHRYRMFTESWERQKSRINSVISEADEESALLIERSLKRETDKNLKHVNLLPAIPASVVILGQSPSRRRRIFSLITSSSEKADGFCVTLQYSFVSTVKSTVRYLISSAIEASCQDLQSEIPKLCKYDMDLLAWWWSRKRLNGKFVVIFQDADSIEPSTFSQVIRLLHLYTPLIPFALVLNVSTSFSIFRDMQDRSTLGLLDLTNIGVGDYNSKNMTSKVLNKVLLDRQLPFTLGPRLLEYIICQNECINASMDDLITSFHVLYMSFFYENPLVALAGSDACLKDKTKLAMYAEGLRSLPSFKRHVSNLLESGDIAQVEALMEKDSMVIKTFLESIESFQTFKRSLSICLKVLLLFQTDQIKDRAMNISTLYSMLISGYLSENTISKTLSSILYLDINSMHHIISEMMDLLNHQDIQDNHLKSVKVCYNAVKGFKTESATSLNDNVEYTSALKSLIQSFENLLSSHLARIEDITFYEVFLYDAVALYQQLTNPCYRSALEAGLTSPTHYLGPSSQPHNDPTKLAYSLYKESPTTINVYDWYQAFSAAMDKFNDGEYEREKVTQALFFRAIAELRFMGLWRPKSRKADIVQRLIWGRL